MYSSSNQIDKLSTAVVDSLITKIVEEQVNNNLDSILFFNEDIDDNFDNIEDLFNNSFELECFDINKSYFNFFYNNVYFDRLYANACLDSLNSVTVLLEYLRKTSILLDININLEEIFINKKTFMDVVSTDSLVNPGLFKKKLPLVYGLYYSKNIGINNINNPYHSFHIFKKEGVEFMDFSYTFKFYFRFFNLHMNQIHTHFNDLNKNNELKSLNLEKYMKLELDFLYKTSYSNIFSFGLNNLNISCK